MKMTIVEIARALKLNLNDPNSHALCRAIYESQKGGK